MYIVSWRGFGPRIREGKTVTEVQTRNTTTNKTLGHPLNAWYVAAWDHEVTRKPMARRIAALYR